MTKSFKFCILLLLTIFISACGGGGGNASGNINDGSGSGIGIGSGSGTISLAVLDGAGKSVTTVTSAGQTLQATYLTASGAAVKQARVAFAVTVGTGVVLEVDSALTDDKGVATVVVRSSGSSVSGVATVSVTSDTVTGSVNFVLSPLGSNVVSLSLVNSDGSTTSTLTFGGGQKIRALYKIANGGVIPNTVVKFAITSGSGAVLGATSALTDEYGVAEVRVDATDSKVSGAVTVSASIGSITGLVNFRVLGAGVPTLNLTVVDSLGNSTTTVTYKGGQRIRAVYRDGANNPIAKTGVIFSITKGAAGTNLLEISALTDESGIAYVNVSSSGPTATGAATVSATAGVATSNVDFAVSAQGSDLLAVSLVDSSGFITNSVTYGGGQRIKAVFSDASGKGKANTYVQFNVSSGTGATLAASSAITDASGVVYVDIGPTSAASLGGATVTGWVGNVVGVVNFSIVATGPGTPTLGLSVLDSSGASTTTVTYNGGQKIRAVYLDGANKPIANTAVSFTVTKGAAGTVLSATSALTDSSGVATVNVSSSGPTAAGAATVSATAGVTAGTVDFAVSAQGSDLLTVFLVNSSDAQTGELTYGGGQRIKAVFTNSLGAVKAGSLVSFSVSSTSGVALAASFAVTNSSGVAYVDIGPASAASVGGATVTGFVGNVVGVVNFSIVATGPGTPTLGLSVLDSSGASTTTVTYNGGQKIRAVYLDGANKPIVNTAVSFTVTKGTAGVVLSVASALTDFTGTAYVNLSSSGLTATGAATVSATAGVTTSTVDFAVSAAGSPTLTLSLENSASATTPTVSFGGGQRVKAVYRDSAGNTLKGSYVNFSISSGTGVNLASNSALTDDNGAAYVNIDAASATTSGAAAITAYVGNVAGVLNVAIKTTAVLPNVLTLGVVTSGNAATSTVSFAGNQKLQFAYKKADGTAISGVRVAFAITAGTGLVTLATDSALTGVDGVASVFVNTVNATAVGAASATASVVTGTVASSTSVDFAVAATPVTLGAFQFGPTALAASATASVSISATANGSAASAIPISLSADCGSLSPAIPLTNGSGTASSTYSSVKADGTSCSGTVTITANASGTTKTGSLSVAAPVASSINFVSASPSAIYVQGSGSTTQSSLKFRVLDATGAAFPNASVTAAITTNPGGVGLGAVNATSALSLQSDSTGYVSFSIYSGAVPGPVQVKVSSSDTVYAYSNNITVQSGPPAQDRFSLSVGTFNLEGQDIDGITTTLTIRVADRQGNAVPDGTVINFTSSGGQVQPSCATARTNGISACSATFSSQSPRPSNGRITVLAFAEGIKTFTDNNRNNTFDSGDTLSDMGDAYRDDNENGTYDSGEFVLPRGGSSVCPTSVWGTPSRADTCDSSTSATTVRSQAVLLMAASSGVLTQTSISSSALTFRANSKTLCSNSTQCLPWAAGTTFTADTTDATSCTAGAVMGGTVPNVFPTSILAAQLGTAHTVLLTAATDKTCSGVSVRVMAKSPSGLATIYSFSVP